MNTSFLNTVKTDIVSWFYAFILLFILIAMAGKQAIAWVLMKLYEFFILRNSRGL